MASKDSERESLGEESHGEEEGPRGGEIPNYAEIRLSRLAGAHFRRRKHEAQLKEEQRPLSPIGSMKVLRQAEQARRQVMGEEEQTNEALGRQSS